MSGRREMLARLQTIVAERAAWSEQLGQVKRMHQWVLDAEHLLDGSWAQAGEVVSNETVGNRLDAWRQQMSGHLAAGSLGELEQECLPQFLQQLVFPAALPGAVLRPRGVPAHE